LAPGWRCDACEYSLEGLPNRAEETQCPECGHTGRPVGAPAVASDAAVVFSLLLSLGSLVAAGFTAWAGWVMLSIIGPEGWIAIALAAGWLVVAVLVWAAVDNRWARGRSLGANVPAGCAAVAPWAQIGRAAWRAG